MNNETIFIIKSFIDDMIRECEVAKQHNVQKINITYRTNYLENISQALQLLFDNYDEYRSDFQNLHQKYFEEIKERRKFQSDLQQLKKCYNTINEILEGDLNE